MKKKILAILAILLFIGTVMAIEYPRTNPPSDPIPLEEPRCGFWCWLQELLWRIFRIFSMHYFDWR